MGCRRSSCSTRCRTACGQWQAGTMDVAVVRRLRARRPGRLRRAGRCARRLGGDGRHRVRPRWAWSPPRFPTAAGWRRWPANSPAPLSRSPLRPARGVTVTELAPDELVSAAADFDVVTASLVQSANGAVLDVDALRAHRGGHRHADRHRHHPGARLEERRRAAGPTSPSPRSTSGCWRRAARRGCR